MSTPQQIPCPLSDSDCETLRNLVATIPQVQQICNDLKECEVVVPHAEETLARSLKIANALLALKAKYG